MTEGKNVQALLKQGIEAARQGDREAARGFFERVVELDEKNEKGWYWLASVVETDEERRICLRNVLHINPDNDRAIKALEKLEAKEKQLAGPGDVIPGVSRRQFALAIGGGALAILVILAAFLVISANTRSRQEADARATQAVYANYTATVVQAATAVVQATETAFANATPTLTPYTPARTQVPTWTPTGTETPFGGDQVTLPMPQGLSGTLAGWGGRDVQNIGYFSVGVYNLTSGDFRVVSDKLGRDVDIQPDGARIAYTRYDEFLFGSLLESINLNGSQPESLNERWRGFLGILNPEMPRYGQGGNWLVFVATDQEVLTTQVYLLNLSIQLPPGANPTNAPSPIRKLTNDRATYTYPAVSPDGRYVVAVRDDRSGPNPGPDLVVIDVQSLEQRSLTTDLGTFSETMPRFSPDGSQVIYAAAPSNDPRNYDIAVRNADGSGVPTVPVRSPANDVAPVYSPDGRNIAFSSNRNGAYDIYIYDVVNGVLSQLTHTPDPDYPGAWWQPAS